MTRLSEHLQTEDGRSPSGPGSRPSDRAASVSAVPASIPNAEDVTGAAWLVEAARQRAICLFQAYVRGVRGRDETAFINDVSAFVESIDAAVAPLKEAAASEDGDSETVGVLRQVANDVLGGNCTFADDDAKLLGGLARLAIAGGLTEGLHGSVLDSINRKHGRGKYAPAQGIEAATADETRSGSAVGESPVGEADAPKTQSQGSNNAPE